MHLHIDCPAGMAGDMFLSAFIDLGLEPATLHEALAPVMHPDLIRFEKIRRRGIVGMLLQPHPEHGVRLIHTFSDVDDLLGRLTLPGRAGERTRAMYEAIHRVESAIHGEELSTVHLHELATVDTFLDITGTAVALELLGIKSVSVDTVPLGSGTVETEHGTLPVPAPATAALLEGIPVNRGVNEGEATTPTAAAIVREYRTTERLPSMTMEGVGYGFGTREGGKIPNVLRLMMGRRESGGAVIQMETTLDDITGQQAAHLIARLMEEGALDAFFQPVTMKKGRPGLLLTLLLSREKMDDLLKIVFTESPTLGVRYTPVQRVILEREKIPVTLPWGTINVKVGYYRGKRVNAMPEFSEVQAIARKAGVDTRTIVLEVLKKLPLVDD